MMSFEAWMQWGAQLSDADFAAAWMALGVARAASAPADTADAQPRASASPKARADIARQVLAKALRSAQALNAPLLWHFPDPADSLDAQGKLALSHIAPHAWAQAWREAAGAAAAAPHLRVVHAPEGTAQLPWLRLLSEAQPAVAAVSIAWDAPHSQLAFSWPLRLGALSASGTDAIARAVFCWPSQYLARHVALDRDNANCDVLVHVGAAATLLGALGAQVFACKANLVVIAGASDASDPALPARLRAIAKLSRASGVVLWTQASDAPTLAGALNGFIETLAHDLPLDQALHLSAQNNAVGSASAWLTDAACVLRLRTLGEALVARADALSEVASIDLGKLSPHWVQRRRAAPGSAFTSAVMPAGAVPSPQDQPIYVGAGSAGGSGTMGAAAGLQRGSARIESTQFDTQALQFNSESQGASELAMLGDAVAAARPTAQTQEQRAARFLQQQSLVRQRRRYRPASSGFIAGEPARVRLRIGPQQEQWQAAPTPFPSNALPPGFQQWRLTLWLTEPNQLARPLRKSIVLPADGASTECEFRFTPKSVGAFDASITVLHRGRVLQTAALRAGVGADAGAGNAKDAPVLEDIAPVRHQLGDLEGRRQFDLAIISAADAVDTPRALAVSGNRTWSVGVAESLAVVKDLNSTLSQVAMSVADYADGLDGEGGRALLVDLAKKGAWLAIYLTHDERGRQPDVAKNEYVQIVSTRSDASVPFEFIYDHPAPNDDAHVCPHWRQSLEQGACAQDCAGGNAQRVCPLGFWGLRKVIERQLVRPGAAAAPGTVVLQSEPGHERSGLAINASALFASSTRVPARARASVTTALKKKLGAAPQTAANWDEWARIVKQQGPHLLLALPHTDGSGANVTLEIGGSTLDAIHITPEHVAANDDAPRPLVALLGCDIHGTADDYGKHVMVFRDRGAAIVIGTIATVFGEHAARVGVLLAQELLPNGAPPQRLGEALRALKRRALLQNLLMPLCVVAYGDADWRLERAS